MEVEQWISVDDRLPIDHDEILIAEFTSFGYNVGVVKGWFSKGFWYINTDGISEYNYGGSATIILDMNVTHWMPLPKLQKTQTFTNNTIDK